MPRLLLRLYLMCLALALIAGAAGAQEVPNLVQNPGFEQVEAGVPTDWTLTGQADLDNVQFYSGAMGLRFSHAEPATSTATQTVNCAQREFTALAWVRLEGVAGTGARLRILGPAGQVIAQSAPVTGDAGWQRLTVSFNPGNLNRVTVELSLAEAAGTAWFDEVIVGNAEAVRTLLADTPEVDGRRNLALGKPYEMSPPPNYEHSTHPDDIIHLTDGEYTVGYYWTQKTTVGWYTFSPQITVDLGRVEAIDGIMINCPGGGAAGVMFPREITYLVSDDNEHFHEVAVLTPKGLRQDGRNWYTHRFLADNLQTRGRYVMIRLDREGSTVFADEIEIYAGDHDPAQVTFTTEPRSRLEMAFGQYSITPTTYTRGHFPETPHVKWALPLSGGPVKAIVMAYSSDMRDVCELAQRLDLDYVPVQNFSFYRPEPLGHLMQEQIETALPEAQVMVVGGYRWEATPEHLLEKIRARVREGMGLVLVASNPQFINTLMPLFDENPLEGDQGILDDVPMALIPAYSRPRTKHFNLATYGEGRIAWVNPGTFGRPAHSLTCDFRLEDLNDDADTPLEYSYVWLSRLILWAAKHDLTGLEVALHDDRRLSVEAAGIPGGGMVEVIVRDPLFDPAERFTAQVPAEGLTTEFTLPGGLNGRHPVDLWLRDADGAIVDFTSTFYTVDNGVRIADITLDRPVYAAGEPIGVTVSLEDNPGNVRVQTRLVDTYGREIAAPVEAPTAGDTAELQVPFSTPVTLAANLFVSLVRDEEVLERRLQRVWLERTEPDDYFHGLVRLGQPAAGIFRPQTAR